MCSESLCSYLCTYARRNLREHAHTVISSILCRLLLLLSLCNPILHFHSTLFLIPLFYRILHLRTQLHFIPFSSLLNPSFVTLLCPFTPTTHLLSSTTRPIGESVGSRAVVGNQILEAPPPSNSDVAGIPGGVRISGPRSIKTGTVMSDRRLSSYEIALF